MTDWRRYDPMGEFDGAPHDELEAAWRSRGRYFIAGLVTGLLMGWLL